MANSNNELARFGDVTGYSGSRYAPASQPVKVVAGRPLRHHETTQDRAMSAAHARSAANAYRAWQKPVPALGAQPKQLADRIHTLQDVATIGQTADNGGGGGGIPTGYYEKTIQMCESGVTNSYIILVKNP